MFSEFTSRLNSIDPDVQFFINNNRCQRYTISDYQDFSTNVHTLGECSVLSYNIRSFHAHIDTFETFLHSIGSHDFIIFCETWNSNITVPLCKLDGYLDFHTFRTDNRRGGGVSVFCLDKYNVYKIDHLSYYSSHIESCVVKVDLKIRGQYMVVLGLYRSPNESENLFMESLELILQDDTIRNSSYIVLAGDLNINMAETGGLCENLVALLHSYLLFPTISLPTRFSPNNYQNSSIIDHIWITHSQLENWNSGVIDLDLSDHCPCFVKFILPEPAPNDSQKRKVQFRPYSTQNFENLCSKLSNFDWNLIFNANVNISWDTFIEKINNSYCNTFSKKTKFISTKRISKPWISSYILTLIKRKSEYFNLYKMNIISRDCNNRFKNFVNSEVRKAKTNYLKNLFLNSVPKSYWSAINRLMGRSKPNFDVNEINFGNEIGSSSLQNKLNNFNEFFSSVALRLEENLPATNSSPVHFLTDRVEDTLNFNLVTEDECHVLISKLKLTKCDIDTIPVHIFKKVSVYLVPPLTKLINSSFATRCFPDALKVAKLSPIFKGGDRTNPTNYRPIASLPFLSKIFERALFNRISNFTVEHSIISKSQYGFRSGVSTLDALINLTECAYESLNSKKHQVSVLLDLRKAFDVVNHGVLCLKLEHYGIRGAALDLLKSYLLDRKHFIKFNNVKSNYEITNIAVPQGSILGPLLFLFYINDLPTLTNNSQIQLFADDTVVSFSHHNFNYLTSIMNEELNTISEWMSSNRLTLNSEKSHALVFSNRTYEQRSIDLCSNPINCVESSKYLGIIFDNRFRFKNHIDYVKSKISKFTGILYRLRKYFPLETCLNYYYAFVYPYLSYCIEIWGGACESHLSPLIIQQKRIIRIIGNARFSDHSSPIFYDLKLLKLQDIYNFKIAIYMYNNSDQFLPRHTLNTRSRNLPVSNFHRLSQTQKAISYHGPKIWCSIPHDIRMSQSVKIFKRRIKEFYIDKYV